MKKASLFIIGAIALFFGISSCEEWTEVEPIVYEANDVNTILQQEDSEYYEKLREYKKSDHPISFAWYAGWSGKGTNTRGKLSGLPDSIDIVSLWSSAAYEKGTEKAADLKYAREVKGIRVVSVIILHGADKELFDWKEEDKGESAIRAYARSIVDTIKKYDYDGFDIDYEPSYIGQNDKNNIVHSKENTIIFIDELSKYLGPLSGTGKLLVLDGEPQKMPSESCLAFDYFIVQAYNSWGDGDLDNRLQSTI
ncbi:glycoside hydrolase family 18 [Flavobacteriaceae bacterium]|nr:glycoside hydrolase family 18 [Flavobacteriaceae bacterium]